MYLVCLLMLSERSFVVEFRSLETYLINVLQIVYVGLLYCGLTAYIWSSYVGIAVGASERKPETTHYSCEFRYNHLVRIFMGL